MGRGGVHNITFLFNKIFAIGFKHVFWSVIVCVAMGCAAIFLYTNTIDFMNATVVTTVDTMTVPLSEVRNVCLLTMTNKSSAVQIDL